MVRNPIVRFLDFVRWLVASEELETTDEAPAGPGPGPGLERGTDHEVAPRRRAETGLGWLLAREPLPLDPCSEPGEPPHAGVNLRWLFRREPLGAQRADDDGPQAHSE